MPIPLRSCLILGAFACNVPSLLAQCGAGELPVMITVQTDPYGNETYWQLVPTGNACGSGTIATGGNPVIGCNGGGTQNSPPGGYGNNTTINEGPYCLVTDASYDLIAIDAYGDDGAAYTVSIDGAAIGQFQQPGGSNTFTFTVHPPEQRDMGVTASTTSLFPEMGLPLRIKGTAHNFGAQAVTAFTLAYRIGAGPVQTMAMSGVDIASGGDLAFIHDVPWDPATPGPVALRIWTADVNGSEDLSHGNDTLTGLLTVNPAVPNIVDDYLALTPVFVEVANSDQDLLVPRDLDFHPDRSRDELWVLNKDTEASGGSTVRFTHPGEADETFLWQRDPNAWHFMSLPTAIAMGDNNNFATSPGVFDANHNGGEPFTGPTLWSSDPAIYAQNLFGPLGSHLDMVHVDPNSQGIAHDQWNRFWVVDGYNGDIVMNDFRSDHGPGNDYHGNAIIRRYSLFTITKDPNDHIVSHCVMDKHSGWLYVVDHGGRRVLRLNTNTGTASGPGSYGPWETYLEYTQMTGYQWEEIVSSGLDKPAGIDLVGDRLLVSDHANGDIIVYDISGSGAPEIGRIHTGAAGIMGIKVGPDGRIWYVNATNHTLSRIDLNPNVGIAETHHAEVTLYPNPVAGKLFIANDRATPGGTPVELLDATGRTSLRGTLAQLRTGLDVSGLAAGQYALRIGGSPGRRIVVTR